MLLDVICEDELALLCSTLDPVSLGKFAQVSRATRDAARVEMRGCNLTHVPRKLNQGDLCDALAITPEEAKALPYRTEERRCVMGTYVTHSFTMTRALPRT